MSDTIFTIPTCIRDYIKAQGYAYPMTEMQAYIDQWRNVLLSRGEFWDFNDYGADNRLYKVHRRTIKPAKRVVEEWASLLLNEDTVISTEDEACNAWLDDYYHRIGFHQRGQGLVAKAFGLGTGAWAVWLDTEKGRMQVRRYDARMVVPLTWDDDGISEVALCSDVYDHGERLHQLQMHVLEDDRYHIRTAFFNTDGRQVYREDVVEDLDTGGEVPLFAIIKPAIENTVVDLSPYGQSVFADAEDVLKSVDLCYDAIFNEVDMGKMRLFLSDLLFEVDKDHDGTRQPVPFGKRDSLIFRKVASTEDVIKEFAPALRTEAQIRAYRMAVQTMGDACGFGLTYFDIDQRGGIRTATEVSSDNSQLMRNIRKHENVLEGAIAQITHGVLHCARAFLDESLPDEGIVTVGFDDSIITDTAAEKHQDMAELNLTLNPWEYRAKWYGEDEDTAKANVPGSYAEPFME